MIKFLSKEVFIEESAGKRKILLIMEEKIRGYEKRMLCDSGCPYTLPMHFISDEGTMKVYYDFTGYVQLEEYIKRKKNTDLSDRESQKTIFDALDVLSKVLGCLKGMESYLIYPERISIHPDVIFINLNSEQIALAFYPNDNTNLTLQYRIIALIDDVNGLCNDHETELYLKKFKDFIFMKNPGLDGMIGNLGMLQREVSYIFCNTKSFRRMEDKETFSEYRGTKGSLKESIESRKPSEKLLSAIFKKPAYLKAIAIQVIFGAVLTAVFLSGILEILNFAGLAVIATGVDLWIMRALRLK